MSDLSRRIAGLTPEKRALLERRLQQGVASNVFPLSFAQERLWFLDQLEPNGTAYTLPALVRLRGSLDAAALHVGLRLMVERHEALRLTFTTVEGRAMQVVAPALELPLPLIDLAAQPEQDREAAAMELVQRRIAEPFDLVRGPLVRALLIRLAADDHLLLLTMHHIVSDGWSMGVLIRELIAAYQAGVSGQPAALPPLPLQYADYAVWQRKRVQGHLLEQQLAYWREQLAGAPPLLALPTDRPRLPVKTSHGATYSWTLSQPLAAALQALSQREGATLFMLLLAAFDIVLQRTSGQDDIVVGSPIAGRTRPEIEGLIGFFVNTLVLRTDLSDNPSFRALLARVREMTLQAYLHQDLPFERLVEALQPARDLRYTPLFQVLFALQNAPLPALDAPGLQITPVRVDSPGAKFDLALTMTETEQGLSGRVEYSADLFDAATIARLATYFETLLQAIVADPDRPIRDLDLLPEAERQRLLIDWNATATAEPADQTIVTLFAAQAARTPDAIAVIAERADGMPATRLSYAELNRRANQLAHYLQAQGVGPERRVGVLLPRSPELIVAILGVLKAGGAYVPLDPAYPPARLAFMIEDAALALLLTDGQSAAPGWPALPAPPHTIDLSASAAEIAQASADNLDSVTSLEQLAYVIYTSGSTGRPKGVLVPHRGLANLAAAQIAAFGLRTESRVLQFASPSFDAAVSEIVTTLLAGATLYLALPSSLLPGYDLLRLLRDAAITVVTLPPSLLAALPDDALPQLETIVAAGEACPAAVARRWSVRVDGRRRRFLNAYGPTEYTVCATIGAVEDPSVSPPIGRPIANTQVYVLDWRMQPVPIGVVGELYVGGLGVARGYLGRPALTAERFLPDPFAQRAPGRPGARLYATGDRARYRADGQIEFVGRGDEQVKLRGFRIEPGEIEAVLNQHPAVREAAVVVRPATAQLVAYVVERERVPPGQTENQEPSSSPAGSQFSVLGSHELRAFLAERLPDYMLPAAFVALDVLPRTPSGKLDRRALPTLDEPQRAATPATAPQTELEQRVAAIWQVLLGVERVGRDDNFFEIGGHSLLMVQVQHQLSVALGRTVAMVDLFRYPTIAALARFLAADEHDDRARLERSHGRAERRRALLHGPAQESVVPARPVAGGIAIIGMAGRFPGAPDIETFWQNLQGGVESVQFFSEQELLDAGCSPALLALPNYVRAGAPLDNIELFDADFFGYSPREAEIMDPQQRLFLECAWSALEHAGYAPDTIKVPTAVYAGVGLNRYWLNLFSNPQIVDALGGFHTVMSNDGDFLTTRVSYKLNLRGPSVNVQSACSTSLVATHMACQSLLHHECDMALAGGVSVNVPVKAGYLYQEGGINSPDGHTRAFDAEARGTIAGSGMGAVILKRLEDALSDGDTIYAVIKGSALNNDGAQKVGYTAPSVDGQAEVIAEAQAVAGVTPAQISYIETHGAGTPLGDPIEVAALTQVFQAGTEQRQFCGLGSVKTNIGHLDAAAGVAGLIKTTLALTHQQIPPSLNFVTPNPEIAWDDSPFYVNAALRPWPGAGQPRRAGVSAFGVGGSNAHLVLEEAPAPAPSDPAQPWQLIPLSAKTPGALAAATERLVRHLEVQTEQNVADLAYTLQLGRTSFNHRQVLVCRDRDDASATLRNDDPLRVLRNVCETTDRPIAFLFAGLGDHYPEMGLELYQREPVFRAAIDRCAALLTPHLGLDLRDVLYPRGIGATPTRNAHPTAAQQRPTIDLTRLLNREPTAPASATADRFNQTEFAQPALFAIEYALAQLWQSWGIRPQVVVGYSLGEYVAACIAGTLALEDALLLVARRAQLIQSLPAGAMLSVYLSPEQLQPLLGPELSLAAINAPSVCVVAGPPAAIDALEASLSSQDIAIRRLTTSHAFHSQMMQPVLEPLARLVQHVTRNPPQIRYLSNVSGTWITAADATDPGYWSRHMRQPVRFAEVIGELWREANYVLVEIGPGQGLAGIAGQHPDAPPAQERVTLQSLGSPHDRQSDRAVLLSALGRLWLQGVPVDWRAVHAQEQRRRLPLPTYPFERQRYWIQRQQPAASAAQPASALYRKPAQRDWLYEPSWTRTPLADAGDARRLSTQAGGWLVFLDALGVGAALVDRLRQAGQQVVTVQTGDQFSRLVEHGYALSPQQPADYTTLLVDLQTQQISFERVVHLWSVTSAAVSFEQAQQTGFYSLVFLAQALEQQRAATPLELTVISNGVQAVTGEEPLQPEKATVLGPTRIIAQEYPHIRCRSIDVTLPAAESRHAQLADRLLADLATPSADFAVAYRGLYRWVQRFEPLALDETQADQPRLRAGGVYLITGGLGYVGLTLAHELTRAPGVRLVLVGRQALPERAMWDYWLAGHDQSDAVSAKIRAVQALEQRGATVLTISADVADQARMRSVIRRVTEEFGALHGVIHAAGAVGEQAFRAIHSLSPTESAWQFQAKVHGTQALEAALADHALDFCILCSSLASMLGGLGFSAYAAANLYMDAFAHRHNRDHPTPWLSVNWEAWQPPAHLERRTGLGAALTGLAITPDEGAQLLRRIIALPPSAQLVISTADLRGRLDHWAGRASEPEPPAQPMPHPRRDIATTYAAPVTEHEQRIAQICEHLLGVAPIGIYDNFFDLGGHSLLAVQLISRLRGEFQVDVSLHTVFEAPTVAQLAAHVAASQVQGDQAETLEEMLQMVEHLSEDEIATLLLGGRQE